MDDLIKMGTPMPDLFSNARSNVAATTRILSGDVDFDAAVQSACLTAELVLKGAIAHFGLDEQGLKSLAFDRPESGARSTSVDGATL